MEGLKASSSTNHLLFPVDFSLLFSTLRLSYCTILHVVSSLLPLHLSLTVRERKGGRGRPFNFWSKSPSPPTAERAHSFPLKKNPPSSHLVSLSPFLTHFLRAGGDEKMGRRRRRCKVLKLTRVVVVVACGGKKREEKG